MTETFYDRDLSPDPKDGPGLPLGRITDDEAISRFDILNLFGKERLEKIQSTIAKATGLALVTLDYKGDPLTEMTGFTPFCQEMRQGENSAQLCRSSDVYGAGQALARQKKYIYFCPCGLLEVAIPIIVRNHYLGGFYGGQVRCDNAPGGITRLGKLFEDDMAKCPLNVKQKKKYKNIAVVDFDYFSNMTDLLTMIISQISEKELVSRSLTKGITDELSTAQYQVRRLETELNLKKSEVVKLKSSLNYHFLINTLNAISNLAVIEDSPRTNEMIILFAEHLRHALPVQKNYLLLTEEINNVERFLKMQKVRYGNLLNFTLKISEDSTMRKIPAHIIMPFVERAVFYGLATREAELNITVSVALKNNDMIIMVTDDGPGLSEEELAIKFAAFDNGYEGEAIHIALAGAHQRLNDIFGQNYELEIKNYPGRGTDSIIRFPARLPAGVI